MNRNDETFGYIIRMLDERQLAKNCGENRMMESNQTSGNGVGSPTCLGFATAALVLGVISFIGVPFCGLTAFILGTIALVKINSSNGLLTGSGKAIAGIIFGAWAFIRIPILGILLLPALNTARDKARWYACSSNLMAVGLMMRMYAEENNDCLPTKKECLKMLNDIDYGPESQSNIDVCPCGGNYTILVNGQKISSIEQPSRTVVAFCPNQHFRNTTVLFANGQVGHVDFQKLIMALMSGGADILPVVEKTVPLPSE